MTLAGALLWGLIESVALWRCRRRERRSEILRPWWSRSSGARR